MELLYGVGHQPRPPAGMAKTSTCWTPMFIADRLWEPNISESTKHHFHSIRIYMHRSNVIYLPDVVAGSALPVIFSNCLFVNLSSRTKSGCQSFVVFGIHCIVHHLHCITCRFESIGHGFRELGDFLLQWASILPGQISWKEGDQKTHNLQKIQWKTPTVAPEKTWMFKIQDFISQ